MNGDNANVHPGPPRRGYSVLPQLGKPTVRGPSTHTNVLIKKRLPARGVVSSNPKRVERLVQHCTERDLLTNVQVHTNAGWGVTIYTGTFKSVDIFIAGVPMGSSGSGFAFFEMFAAGAQAIIRYGSNDRQVTMDNLRDLIVVDQTDNLIGLPYGAGYTNVDASQVIEASMELVDLLEEKATQSKLPVKKMICHNVEDYHAYNFSEFFEDGEAIRDQVSQLEQRKDTSRLDCWDMETAALFWRAKQFGLHAATVLQNLYKKPGTTPYDGEHGKISLAMETDFYNTIFDALHDFCPKEPQQNESSELALRQSDRSLRRLASQDLIGVEEPLSHHDTENESI